MPLSLRCFPARAVARASLCALLVAAPLGLPAVRASSASSGSRGLRVRPPALSETIRSALRRGAWPATADRRSPRPQPR